MFAIGVHGLANQRDGDTQERVHCGYEHLVHKNLCQALCLDLYTFMQVSYIALMNQLEFPFLLNQNEKKNRYLIYNSLSLLRR